MADLLFSNYGELKASLAEYIYGRKDLTGKIPGFILFGEKRIFRRLRTRENQGTDSGTVTTSIALPENYRTTKVLEVDDRPLDRVSDRELKSLQRTQTAAGEPKKFARVGSTLELWPAPAEEMNYVHEYFEDLSGTLSADGDTNAILTEYPQLYVYAAMIEAMPYLAKDERLVPWKSMYDAALAEANGEYEDQEYSGSEVEVTNAYGDSLNAY